MYSRGVRYGGQDGGIPLTTVNEMKDALAAAGARGNAAARGRQFPMVLTILNGCHV